MRLPWRRPKDGLVPSASPVDRIDEAKIDLLAFDTYFGGLPCLMYDVSEVVPFVVVGVVRMPFGLRNRVSFRDRRGQPGGQHDAGLPPGALPVFN
jgi:hypothetical protein